MAWLHLSKEGYWAQHPALLPSMVIAFYNLIATLSCIFLLPETNARRKPLTNMKAVVLSWTIWGSSGVTPLSTPPTWWCRR
ncbi:hypothetical protein STCU_12058 [Strigomonas culicis]|uniref:Uncharacterized protein n=1 Tax=Strigomonas culicis TaxID=28005 RepID=S9UL31_9TRYP|nr:hypothetical protein STCU_12058 [Strigomonas culicis]|eukprot:EPY15396.1 hypothetical protein STCU_12058 [Strigomonas culicis]